MVDKMKKILFLSIFFITVQNNCSINDAMVGGTNDTGDIIFDPKVESIIPFYRDYSIRLKWNKFDSSGNIILPESILKIKIPDIYVFESDTNVISFSNSIHDSTNTPFLFKYEYDDSNKGVFLSYITDDTLTHGIYEFGTYKVDSIYLYNKPKLWLKYPGEAGDKWNYLKEDSNAIEYELLNTKEPFLIPGNSTNSLSPITSFECYLFKKTENTTTQYLFFHENYGMVGYLLYENDILKRSARKTNIYY